MFMQKQNDIHVLLSSKTTVLKERMWHFRRGALVKTYSDPSYIFSGVRTPNPQDLHPPDRVSFWLGIRAYFCQLNKRLNTYSTFVHH